MLSLAITSCGAVGSEPTSSVEARSADPSTPAAPRPEEPSPPAIPPADPAIVARYADSPLRDAMRRLRDRMYVLGETRGDLAGWDAELAGFSAYIVTRMQDPANHAELTEEIAPGLMPLRARTDVTRVHELVAALPAVSPELAARLRDAPDVLREMMAMVREAYSRLAGAAQTEVPTE